MFILGSYNTIQYKTYNAPYVTKMLFVAHRKARSGIAISVNWTLSLGVTAKALLANIELKSALLLERVSLTPKFQVEGVALHQPFFSQETRMNDLSFDMRIWA